MAEPVVQRSPLQTLAWASDWPTLAVSTSYTLREVPFQSQINLRYRAQDGDGASTDPVDRVRTALGLAPPLEPNTTATAGQTTVLWLGPDEWLVVSPPGDAARVETSLRQALASHWGSVVDVSAHRTVIELSGQDARSILARGCPLDLHPRVFHPGSCAQSLLAKAPVLLWQQDSIPTYWIFVRASFAEYVAAWFRHTLSDGAP
jgi:sarcosine oxidase subunit gamma